MMQTEQSARVSTIRGDLLCCACGFNLFGQPVSRDTGTGLLVARCPECGTAAALQEYPGPFRALKWISGALITLWLLLILMLFGGTAGLMFGTTLALREVAIEETSVEIAQRHAKWFEESNQAIKLNADVQAGTLLPAICDQIVQQARAGASSWVGVSDAWWISVDDKSMVRWPWSGRGDEAVRSAIAGLFLGVGIVACGVILATAMPGVRGWRFAVVMLVVAGVAAAGYVMLGMTGATRGWRAIPGYTTARELAAQAVPLSAGFVMIAIQGSLLLMGMWAGRKVSRWVVRGVLPERLARQLHVLWDADGVEYPRGQRRQRTWAHGLEDKPVAHTRR
jgi:hypothetical protein